MSAPTIRIRRLRLELPARFRTTAVADARRIAEAAALAIHQRAGKDLAAGGSIDLPAVEVQGAGRPAAALANEVAGRVGSAIRGGG